MINGPCCALVDGSKAWRSACSAPPDIPGASVCSVSSEVRLRAPSSGALFQMHPRLSQYDCWLELLLSSRWRTLLIPLTVKLWLLFFFLAILGCSGLYANVWSCTDVHVLQVGLSVSRLGRNSLASEPSTPNSMQTQVVRGMGSASKDCALNTAAG